jgi:hypothetical protein
MIVSLSQLLEDSFQIAWEYLERTGELGDAAAASRFLSDTIETMIRRGQRSRLVLSPVRPIWHLTERRVRRKIWQGMIASIMLAFRSPMPGRLSGTRRPLRCR